MDEHLQSDCPSDRQMNQPPSGDQLEPNAIPQEEWHTTVQVRRALDGDQQSLAWLIEHLSPLLISQARYRLSKHLAGVYDPEDLVQDVWVTALTKLAAIKPRNNRLTPPLLKFLSQVMLNLYRNLLKRHVHGKPLKLRLGGSSVGPHGIGELTEEQTGVLSNAMRSEVAEQIRAGIDRLSDGEREIIVLRGIEGCSNSEAAVTLGVNEGAVAVRYHRALGKLKAVLPESIFSEFSRDLS